MLDVSIDAWLPQLEAAGTLLVAALLGALIGMERELKSRSAGLRTHALIALACSLFIESGTFLFEVYIAEYNVESLRVEPAGIFQGVIIAIGFVAGGAILKDAKRGRVDNLTTACTVMCAGAVGACVGMELYVLATLCSLLVVVINAAGFRFEQAVIHQDDDDTK